jgi:signal peptidase I
MEEQANSGRLPSWLRTVVLGRRPKYTIVRIILLIVVTACVFPFVLLPIKVDGISMEPTYHNGKVNFINRFAYWRGEPRRGDIVGFRYSTHSSMYMKRVIGLPGESVAFFRGKVLINGEPLDEPYVKLFNRSWNRDYGILGPDEYLVVGDNRGMIIDEHIFGKVERRRIVGKVLL